MVFSRVRLEVEEMKQKTKDEEDVSRLHTTSEIDIYMEIHIQYITSCFCLDVAHSHN